jgi:hypothetical protein
MLQEQQPMSTPLHLQPGDVHHYRGFEIYLSDVSRRLVCSYFVTGLKRYCRDVTHGEELIDAYHTAQALPREPGSMRILAADVRVTNSMTAHESRRRSEQARGQKRKGGKFTAERHEQLEQQQAQVAVALSTTRLPLSPCLVTEEDMGYEPFSPEDIAQNIERGEELSSDIYQVGPKPDLMDCAFVLGNLSGIGTQLLLELGKRTLENEQLRAELARVKPAPRVRKSRSKPGLGRQVKDGAA